MVVHTLHVSNHGQRPLKTQECQGRHDLLHQGGYTSFHAPVRVCEMIWINVPMVEAQWWYTYCMVHIMVKGPPEPRNVRVDMICCTRVATLASMHQ
jgi:hypothetical protein